MGKSGLMSLTIAAVVVLVVGASITAALLRHDGKSGTGAGHGHGGDADGMKMDEAKSGGHGHGGDADGMTMDEKGMQMGEKGTAGHPAGHGGEEKGQPPGQADAHGGAGVAAKPKSMQGRAMPSTAPSAAKMLEPFLSGSSADTKSGAGAGQQQQKPPAKQPEKSHSDGHNP